MIVRGGTVKRSTPLATDEGVRNPDNVIVDFFNEELVDLMFEDLSIPASKLIGSGNMAIGEISTGNTTTTPLGIGGVFTGVAEENEFSSVIVGLKTNQNGTLELQFSQDGTNWDSSLTYSITANIYEIHKLEKGFRYFRAIVTNTSGSPQTYLRMITVYGQFSALTAPLTLPISDDSDAILTKSVLVGKTSQDNYLNVGANEGGSLLTSKFLLEVSLGNIENYELEDIFGYNPDINIGTTPEDVWFNGGIYTGFPTNTPETVDVLSSSANDTAAGTGARTVRIFGLKTNTSEEYESEDIILNGTTPVTSVDVWYRVNKIVVLTAGSSEENEGNITVRQTTTTANVFAVAPVGANNSLLCVYTVPYNKTGALLGLSCKMARNNGSAGSAEGSLRVREVGGVFNSNAFFEITDSSSHTSLPDSVIILEALSDVKISIESVSDNGTSVSGELTILLN